MRRLVFALWCLAGILPAYAQNSGGGIAPGVPLGVEIQNLEKTLSRPGALPAEKHDAFVRLAHLHQLSGDIENAAKNYLEAAAYPPDDASLIAGAYCLGAMGEWEKARAALQPLLAAALQGSRPVERGILLQARYLEACAGLWGSGDAAGMAALAENPEYAPMRPALYYTLWRAGTGSPAAEYWKSRLLAEFPYSPEGRIAAGGNAAPLVSANPGMMWLLLSRPASPAPQSAPATPPPAPVAATPPTSPPAPATPPAPVAATPPPAPPAPAKMPTPPPAAASPAPLTPTSAATTAAPAKVLQVGLFSSEKNARALSDKLANGGFTPALSRKTVNGVEYWLVTVAPGPDINRTIAELKKAGFESFPVNKP